jgi:hypothetical protein
MRRALWYDQRAGLALRPLRNPYHTGLFLNVPTNIRVMKALPSFCCCRVLPDPRLDQTALTSGMIFVPLSSAVDWG